MNDFLWSLGEAMDLEVRQVKPSVVVAEWRRVTACILRLVFSEPWPEPLPPAQPYQSSILVCTKVPAVVREASEDVSERWEVEVIARLFALLPICLHDTVLPVQSKERTTKAHSRLVM